MKNSREFHFDLQQWVRKPDRDKTPEEIKKNFEAAVKARKEETTSGQQGYAATAREQELTPDSTPDSTTPTAPKQTTSGEALAAKKAEKPKKKLNRITQRKQNQKKDDTPPATTVKKYCWSYCLNYSHGGKNCNNKHPNKQSILIKPEDSLYHLSVATHRYPSFTTMIQISFSSHQCKAKRPNQ
jgi:hypothetical protein